ncbi:pseudaminic acid cytidylyltransferase [Gammaproteobacteria bacterium]|nr:pseudaminic acid cytidylyltransferase [Gammaproteobacteria bacterium]
MSICIIPARGGSKRIARKNIKYFCGKPMIAWSIQAAQKSNIFSEILISTDDEEIATLAESFGAKSPFLRPSDLADDYATTGAVMAHACQWIKDEGIKSKFVCCLYPTAPFVQPSELKEALSIIETGNWKYVFTAGEYSSPIFRSFTQELNGGIKMLFPKNFETRSQDFENVYHDAGMFYFGSLDTWIKGDKVFDCSSFPLKIPSWRVQDIDTNDDWVRAEMLASLILKNN